MLEEPKNLELEFFIIYEEMGLGLAVDEHMNLAVETSMKRVLLLGMGGFMQIKGIYLVLIEIFYLHGSKLMT